MIYCLLPCFYLPAYDRNYNPDKLRGEKTFSKMMMNIALMNTKCRFEWLSGYWTAYQQNPF